MTNQSKEFKILIMGISGDYAKRKVLPSIGKFLGHYGEKVDFEIQGYSRSKVEESEIRNIINQHCNYNFSIKLETGDYSDLSFFKRELEILDQNQRLVCYLALPPSVYLEFLHNLSKIKNKNYTILIEKPFGRNKKEAKEISQTIIDNGLYNNIFFVDHYLFKSASRLPLEFLFNRYSLTFEDLKEVKIRALEKIGVEGRIGYYNETGAFKDMFPHLYSLYVFSLQNLGYTAPASSIKIISHKIETYQGYKEELLKINDSINHFADTYFHTVAFEYYPNKSIKLNFESGKMQNQKVTEASFIFDDYLVDLNIYPKNYLTVFKKLHNGKLKTVETVPVLDTFFDDHERMFKDILENNYKYFIKADEIIEYWDIIEEVEFKLDSQEL